MIPWLQTFYHGAHMGYLGEFFYIAAMAILIVGLLKKSAQSASHTISFALLALSFLCFMLGHSVDDFQLLNVFLHSHTHKPLMYKIAGAWGSHEGSLFLWCVLLSAYTLLYKRLTHSMVQGHKNQLSLLSLSLPLLSVMQLGFLTLAYAVSNPFTRLAHVPAQGQDLNPVLQDISLAIHPPHLYLGALGFVMPFIIILSLCILSCIAPDRAQHLKRATSSFVRASLLLALSFLTIGIVLGSFWAYYELGWGGWWNFDPIENLALIPWLLGLAAFHQHMITSKRTPSPPPGDGVDGIILLTFLSCLLSLTLVRSGVLDSVHSFGDAPERGLFFASLLILWTLVAGGPYIRARLFFFKDLSVSLTLYSLRMRCVLWTMTGVILSAGILMVGTLYPWISSFFGAIHMIDFHFYQESFIPIWAVIVCVMMFVYKPNTSDLKSTFVLGGLISLTLGLWLLPPEDWFAKSWVAIMLCGLTIAFVLSFLIDLTIKQVPITLKMIAHNGAHLSVLVTALGILLPSFWGQEHTYVIKEGGTIHLPLPLNQGEMTLTLTDVQRHKTPTYDSMIGRMHVRLDHKTIAFLSPEERIYAQNTRHLEADFTTYHGLSHVLLMFGKSDDNLFIIRVTLKPFIHLMWGGFICLIISMLLSFLRHIRWRRTKDIAYNEKDYP